MLNLNRSNMQIIQLRKYIALVSIVFLVACGGSAATKPTGKSGAVTKSGVGKPSSPKGGGYYLDDGPGGNAPANIDNIPDATLITEAPIARANRPYVALGQKYIPTTAYAPYKKQGMASWYGKRYHGRKTSVGEVYDMYAMSGAHTTLPLPSFVKVTNPDNGRSVIVRINDRGPFKHDRIIDLSYAAAYKLRLIEQGSGLVEVEALDTSAEALAKLNIAPAKNVEVVTSTSPVESTSSTGYFVQAGAFKNETNGELLQKKILGLQLAENVGVASVYNGNLYRVKLGPYASREEADVSAANIRKRLNISAIVQNQ
jgi:rare lipoprotein A